MIILDDERLDDQEVDTLEETEETVEVTPEVPEEIVPDKYQGKSLEEVVHMHQEAEKLLGRQSGEVGELRKVVDQYINVQTELTKAAPEPVEEIDFFEDPQKAVQYQIDNHPSILEARRAADQYKKTDTLTKLQAKYPNLEATVHDPLFAEWVKASRIRTQLYAQADQGSDFDAADELLSNWGARQSTVEQTAKVEKETRKQAVKQASTGNVRGSGETSRKVYRRADIIKLMKTDPDRYESMSDEIMAAYKDGRVK